MSDLYEAATERIDGDANRRRVLALIRKQVPDVTRSEFPCYYPKGTVQRAVCEGGWCIGDYVRPELVPARKRPEPTAAKVYRSGGKPRPRLTALVEAKCKQVCYQLYRSLQAKRLSTDYRAHLGLVWVDEKQRLAKELVKRDGKHSRSAVVYWVVRNVIATELMNTHVAIGNYKMEVTTEANDEADDNKAQAAEEGTLVPVGTLGDDAEPSAFPPSMYGLVMANPVPIPSNVQTCPVNAWPPKYGRWETVKLKNMNKTKRFEVALTHTEYMDRLDNPPPYVRPERVPYVDWAEMVKRLRKLDKLDTLLLELRFTRWRRNYAWSHVAAGATDELSLPQPLTVEYVRQAVTDAVEYVRH